MCDGPFKVIFIGLNAAGGSVDAVGIVVEGVTFAAEADIPIYCRGIC